MTYAEKLKDPRWQRKRLKILERDKWTCQHCGSKETELHVHHIKYSGDPWESKNNFLITLCKYCHSFSTESEITINPEYKCELMHHETPYGEMTTRVCDLKNDHLYIEELAKGKYFSVVVPKSCLKIFFKDE